MPVPCSWVTLMMMWEISNGTRKNYFAYLCVSLLLLVDQSDGESSAISFFGRSRYVS
jgi:hypothetical protein